MAHKAVITIDGPSGSGKSTVARGLAKRLRFAFLDTGAIYRTATWYAWSQGLDLGQPAAVLEALDALELRLVESSAGMLVFVNSEEVTERLRSRAVTNAIYRLADRPEVRDWAVRLQRQYAEGKRIVGEGRDLGTVVFPEADLKVYLEASLEVRALRRQRELAARGEAADLAALQEELRCRDQRDGTRAVAPLRVPEGALRLDSSSLTVEQVIEALAQEAERRGLVA